MTAGCRSSNSARMDAPCNTYDWVESPIHGIANGMVISLGSIQRPNRKVRHLQVSWLRFTPRAYRDRTGIEKNVPDIAPPVHPRPTRIPPLVERSASEEKSRGDRTTHNRGRPSSVVTR